MFSVGDKVEHILSKEWLLVLDFDRENDIVICRAKDLRVVKINFWELKLVSIRK